MSAPLLAAPSGRDDSIVPLHRELERGVRLTDVGNAQRFAIRHGETAHYIPAWGSWITYVGGRWSRDDSGAVERMAKSTVLSFYLDAHSTTDDMERRQLVRWAQESEKAHKLAALISLAKSEPGMVARPSQLDADPWLFNVANGTVDLRTGILRPHDRADLLTKQAPVLYDPAARCDRWESFLSEIFSGNEPLIRFMQRAIGYSLTGQTTEQCLFLLYGLGANGKSVLLEVLRRLLGDYARSADFSTFLERRGDGPRNDVARLAGARLVTSSEVSEGRRLSESLVKSLTGGDVIAARFLNQEHFEFAPQFKLWMAANHKPQIRGTDHGIWRRIKLVPFMVQIPEERQDKNLVNVLMDELPGILAWAVAGCIMWQQHGLGAPAEVQAATAQYREEMDQLGPFIEERCVTGKDCSVGATELYAAYSQWCSSAEERPMSRQKFGTQMTERGFESLKMGTIRRVGIKLKGGAS